MTAFIIQRLRPASSACPTPSPRSERIQVSVRETFFIIIINANAEYPGRAEMRHVISDGGRHSEIAVVGAY